MYSPDLSCVCPTLVRVRSVFAGPDYKSICLRPRPSTARNRIGPCAPLRDFRSGPAWTWDHWIVRRAICWWSPADRRKSSWRIRDSNAADWSARFVRGFWRLAGPLRPATDSEKRSESSSSDRGWDHRCPRRCRRWTCVWARLPRCFTKKRNNIRINVFLCIDST